MQSYDHKTKGLARPCSPHDLFLVTEGIQCGNCMVLVKDNRPHYKYATFSRPHGVGGGWRYHRTVDAIDPAHALELTWKEKAYTHDGYLDGSPQKPFTANGGVSQFCAVKDGHPSSLDFNPDSP